MNSALAHSGESPNYDDGQLDIAGAHTVCTLGKSEQLNGTQHRSLALDLRIISLGQLNFSRLIHTHTLLLPSLATADRW